MNDRTPPDEDLTGVGAASPTRSAQPVLNVKESPLV
jgi:hypothetical protein